MKNRKFVKLVSLTLILALVTFGAGCGLVDKLKENFNGEEEPEIVVETSETSEQEATDFSTQDEEGEESKDFESVQPPDQETIAVELWFASADGENLVKEVREIPKVEGIARQTINELIQGPSPESNLLPTIPLGTELRDINVKDNGLIIVDFSKELIENHIGDPRAEALTVYSIVNTLCQFPTVDRVQFLVEGKYVDTIAGSIDVSSALSPKEL